MPSPDAPLLVKCMYGSGSSDNLKAEGGLAVVHWLPDVPPAQLVERGEAMVAAFPNRAHTTVLVAGASGRYAVESYSPAGTRIQLCGHGALAAAWMLFNGSEANTERLAFTNKQHSWQAQRSDLAAADIVLVYPSPLPVVCPVPDFGALCFASSPRAAARVGGATDYLILEFSGSQTIATLQPDFAALSAATARAVIATSAAVLPTENGSRAGCVFRYFAPQYGEPEDAATGSAALQLAAYWSPQIGTHYFPARQLSPQGALMELGCHDGVVELAGRVGYG